MVESAPAPLQQMSDSPKPSNTLHEGRSNRDMSSDPVTHQPLEDLSNDKGRSSLSSSVQSRPLSRTKRRVVDVLSVLRMREPCPSFSHPFAHERTRDDYIVDFAGPNDPYRPLNWPFTKKMFTTCLYGFMTMAATFATTVYAPAGPAVSEAFHIGSEISTLGTSLMLWGFGLGPMLWAPLSELFGRKLAVLSPMFVAAIFAFGAGAAKDIQTLLICHFFLGFFASATVTNTGGVIADIWPPEQRGAAMSGYAVAVVGGPTLGPIVGTAICESYLGWRWTQYITGIFQLFVVFLAVLTVDETYSAVLLVAKARALRYQTGNWTLHARHEEWNVSLKELANKYLVRPFRLLGTPICAAVSIYSGFVYGILYSCLGAFPIEFQEIRGWSPVVGALPFLALFLGVIFGAGLNLLNQKFYLKRLEANNFRPVPEARLPPMMAGSVIFAGGLFLFAWTSHARDFWLLPCLGVLLTGVGFVTILQAALNYLVDTFQRYGASAMATSTISRFAAAGAFPLFITQMLHAMGVDWGVSVFAFISIGLLPIPYLFYFFGRTIRARDRWSKESITA